MEEIKRVISIDTGQSTQTVKGLKKEISDLKDSLLNTEKGGKQWEDTVKTLIDKQEQLASVTKITKQTNDAAKDSIVGLQQQYKSLYDTYKLLSEEQRNSDFGKNMAKSLADLHEKLNSTKMAVGNFKDNIGNYTQSAMQAFQQMGISVGALSGPMKVATVASNGLGKSLKALVANPVGAIIMAIVVAFKALEAIVNRVKEAINNNEESQMRLKEAMSAFQPVIDGVANAFDWLAQKVVSVIGFISEAFSKLREINAAITDFLGITNGAKERVQEQNAVYKELAKSQNELTKSKREYQKLNAEDEAEVARLREEAENAENLLDKRNLLNQAKDKQAEIDARNVELAQENLRILQEESKLTANDAAMNDKLAKAEADVATARANAAKNARLYDRQLNTVEKTLSKTKDTTEDARKEVEKMDEIIRQSHLSKIQKLEEERDKWIEIYKAAGKATEGVEAYYNQQISDVRKQQNLDVYNSLAKLKGEDTRVADYIENLINLKKKSSQDENYKRAIKEANDIANQRDAVEDAMTAAEKRLKAAQTKEEQASQAEDNARKAYNNAKNAYDKTKAEIDRLEEENQKVAQFLGYKYIGDDRQTQAKEIISENGKKIKELKATLKPYTTELSNLTAAQNAYNKAIGESAVAQTEFNQAAEKFNNLDKVFDDVLNQKQISKEDFNILTGNLTAALSNYLKIELKPDESKVGKSIKNYFNEVYKLVENENNSAKIHEILKEYETTISKALKDNFGIETGDSLKIQQQIQDKIKEIVDKWREIQDNDEITDEDKTVLQHLANQLNELKTISDALGVYNDGWNEIWNRYKGVLGTLADKNAQVIDKVKKETDAFFGTDTDAKGFIVSGGTALGRALKNSEIAWQHWGNAVSTVINTVTDAWQKNLEQKVKDGEMSEEMAKEEFKNIKALQYGLAGINMAAGIVSVFSDPSLVTWYAKIAAAASVAATGVAQMVAISQTQFGQSSVGGGISSIVRPQMMNNDPYSYTRQVQTEEEREQANQPIFVSVVDIENAQNQRQVRVRESSF